MATIANMNISIGAITEKFVAGLASAKSKLSQFAGDVRRISGNGFAGGSSSSFAASKGGGSPSQFGITNAILPNGKLFGTIGAGAIIGAVGRTLNNSLPGELGKLSEPFGEVSKSAKAVESTFDKITGAALDFVDGLARAIPIFNNFYEFGRKLVGDSTMDEAGRIGDRFERSKNLIGLKDQFRLEQALNAPGERERIMAQREQEMQAIDDELEERTKFIRKNADNIQAQTQMIEEAEKAAQAKRDRATQEAMERLHQVDDKEARAAEQRAKSLGAGFDAIDTVFGSLRQKRDGGDGKTRSDEQAELDRMAIEEAEKLHKTVKGLAADQKRGADAMVTLANSMVGFA